MAKKALCIGINDYPGTGSDLAGCVNGALLRTRNDWLHTATWSRDLGTFLANRQAFEIAPAPDAGVSAAGMQQSSLRGTDSRLTAARMRRGANGRGQSHCAPAANGPRNGPTPETRTVSR